MPEKYAIGGQQQIWLLSCKATHCTLQVNICHWEFTKLAALLDNTVQMKEKRLIFSAGVKQMAG
jgi:hypothetical protein